MRTTVTRIERRHDNSPCRALVNVMIPDLGMELLGVRIMERSDGSMFAQLPNQRDHRGRWFPVIRFNSSEDAEAVKAAALEAAMP